MLSVQINEKIGKRLTRNTKIYKHKSKAKD